uniref:DNA (cytosine-5-)-methyltransferase n=1 Tax=Candidatus Kentrum sp. TC TaxID=2126339 RepID=A0A451A7N3_9GAMM|nr:MAG: DNA (cytosine-5)-methyltransferase 1 [Candidatus Kentron sp. TC]
MARAGLGDGWECKFSNDFDGKKCAIYQRNWGGSELAHKDVANVSTSEIPETPDLAWASFPCQDLSLAGAGAGLEGERSGTFWPYWKLMSSLINEGRGPRAIVLENVVGTLSSHQGKDFGAICKALNEKNYRFGAVVIDAALFVPQSRPRLFIIAIREDMALSEHVSSNAAVAPWHTKAIQNAFGELPAKLKENWIWWNFEAPPKQTAKLTEIIEDDPDSVSWHSQADTKKLLDMMSDINLEKVEAAKSSGKRVVGTIYKRTRRDKNGIKVQRAEIRFDDVAGCLRTPAGGSSRQLIMVVEGHKIRSRLISSRETARLMGLADSYQLPDKYNEAYHLTGDGVVVPVVRHLAAHVIEPILHELNNAKGRAAA